MRKIISAVLACLLMCAAVAALAEYKVNIEGLQAIQQQDDFGVRITSIRISPGVDGNDFVHFTILNDTDHMVRTVRVFFLMYNEAHHQLLPDGRFDYPLKEFVPLAFTQRNVAIPAHATWDTGFYCNADSLAGVQAIVASYAIDEGDAGPVVIANPNADVWFDAAYVAEVPADAE